MATYPFNTTIPNPVGVGVGTEATANAMPTLASAINAGHARNAGVLVSQTFREGTTLCYQSVANAAGPKGVIASWLVPQISAGHTACGASIRFMRLDMTGANVAGTISLKIGSSVLGSITLDTTYADLTASTVALDITIPYTSSEYQRIDLVVDWPDHDPSGSNDDTGFIVRAVHIHTKPLASPLASGVVETSGGQFVPIGQAATASGAPFSAALGKALIDDLDAIDKRRKPVFSLSMAHFLTVIESLLYVTHKTKSTLRPNDLHCFGTHVVRNCPQGLRLRVVAELEATGEATATAVFAAGPAGEGFGYAGDHDQGSAATLALTVANSQTQIATGYLTVSTPSRLSMCPDAHITAGLMSHDQAVQSLGVTGPAANVKSFSIWEDPT